jgi:hypothetical protein
MRAGRARARGGRARDAHARREARAPSERHFGFDVLKNHDRVLGFRSRAAHDARLGAAGADRGDGGTRVEDDDETSARDSAVVARRMRSTKWHRGDVSTRYRAPRSVIEADPPPAGA